MLRAFLEDEGQGAMVAATLSAPFLIPVPNFCR
jgi:hypothetical protein